MTQCITLFDETIYLSHVFIRGTRLKEFLKNNINVQSVIEENIKITTTTYNREKVVKHIMHVPILFAFKLLDEYYRYSEQSFERKCSFNDLFEFNVLGFGREEHYMEETLLRMSTFGYVCFLLQVDRKYLRCEDDFINCVEDILDRITKHKVEYPNTRLSHLLDDITRRINLTLKTGDRFTLLNNLKRNENIILQIRNNLSRGVFSKLRFI